MNAAAMLPEALGLPSLMLGTVQMGLAYGIMNGREPIAREAVREILQLAWTSGIDALDTAATYGDAERVIGQVRPQDARFNIVSKTPRLDPHVEGEAGIRQVSRRVYASLDLLRVDCLAGLLVHHPQDLLDRRGEDLFGELLRLKAESVVQRVGISVYDPETLAAILDRFPIEIVQLPLNVFDQRFVRAGMISALARRGIEIHARSAFLQGVLMAEPDRLPKAVARAKAAILSFRSRAGDHGLSPLEAALAFVSKCRGIQRIVVGVDSSLHLREIVGAFTNAQAGSFDADGLAVDDIELIDPRRWNAG